MARNDRLILPAHILCHFFGHVICDRCGRTPELLTLALASVRRVNHAIDLNYRWECSCGCRGPMRVELPFLFFGFLVGVYAFLDASRGRIRHQIVVRPGPSDLLGYQAHQFEEAMAAWKKATAPSSHTNESAASSEVETTSPGPDEFDFLKFGMNWTEWENFLRRLGFENNGPSKPPF